MPTLTMCYRDQQIVIDSTVTEEGRCRWSCKNISGVVVEGNDQSELVDLIIEKLDERFDQEGIKSNELELEQEFKEYKIGPS
jgi:hypothetical protein